MGAIAPSTKGSVPGLPRKTEWPTVAVGLLIYGGFLGATWFWREIPLWLLPVVGAWLIAWHGSFLHEIIHGHPTPWRELNRALAWPPLTLWLPFEIYRVDHIKHHYEPDLTDPREDPETAYVTPAAWARLGPVMRWLLLANMTLAGRLTIGPFLSIGYFLRNEARRLWAGQPGRRGIWARQALGAALVVAWVSVVCGMPLWLYLATFVYAGAALTSLRSFAEHRFAEDATHRTAIVERAGLFGLLFLHNNLHVLHHMRQHEPWYRLPALYRADRAALVARNGGLVYAGYGEVARRFLWRAHDKPVYPSIG
jgi:fatty acid desaturase